MKLNTACILLGSNIDPVKYLCLAFSILEREYVIIRKSNIWKTEAFGSSGPDFLNAAVIINTDEDPVQLKQTLQSIESQLGRVRSPNKYDPRTIDLDILTFNDKPMDENLFTKAFAAIPAAELLPDLKNPTTQLTLKSIAKKYHGTSNIQMQKECLG